MSEKTCGNCELRNSGYMMCRSKPYLSKGCGFWNESRASLKQRFKQLEQVAKEMLKLLPDKMYYVEFSLNEFLDKSSGTYKQVFRKQLEALGVSLDD